MGLRSSSRLGVMQGDIWQGFAEEEIRQRAGVWAIVCLRRGKRRVRNTGNNHEAKDMAWRTQGTGRRLAWPGWNWLLWLAKAMLGCEPWLMGTPRRLFLHLHLISVRTACAHAGNTYHCWASGRDHVGEKSAFKPKDFWHQIHACPIMFGSPLNELGGRPAAKGRASEFRSTKSSWELSGYRGTVSSPGGERELSFLHLPVMVDPEGALRPLARFRHKRFL